ncbi:MAG: hypothetical protein ACE5GW_12015, partial [Planctomycetota bacterium]
MRRTVLLKLLLLVLSSLGGAGCRRSSSSDEGPPSLTIVYELDGLSFGPFSAGEDPLQGDSISEAELRRRLGWVAPYARRL